MAGVVYRLSVWIPVTEELAAQFKYYNREAGELLLRAPELLDGDFNPHGVAPGYWQDDEGWIGALWDGCCDEWRRKVVTPTHFMVLPGPQS